MSDTYPRDFGRFRLLELLGEGGMARVYRALLPGPMGFEKEVALKIIDPKFTDDPQKRKLFVNEARLGGKLKHRNIVEIYDFGEEGGQFFLSMELVDGWELRKLLGPPQHAQALPPRIALEVMIKMCEGLTYAHELRDGATGELVNLVHRDLKPGNILISRTGEVKVMDFGIAKAASNLYQTRDAEVTRGTPPYMSPEQVNKSVELDARSDLFAAGAILHELLTGQSLFTGDKLLNIMYAVLNCNEPAPKGVAQERMEVHSPEVRSVLDSCIQINRNRRYASAREMGRDLKVLLRQTPGQTLEEWLEDNPPTPRRAVGSLEGPGPTRDQAPAAPILLEDKAPLEEPVEGPPSPVELRFTIAPKVVTPEGVPSLAAAPAPPDPMATRAQQPVVKGRTPSRALAAVLGGLVLLLAGAALVFLTSETQVPVVESAEAVETPPPAEPPETLMNLAEEETPTPELIVESTPTPTPEPTPERVVQRDLALTPVVRDATPEPTPEVETPDTGTVTFNSRPWSQVFINGTRVGRTALQNHQLPAGDHVAELRCATCKEGTPPVVIEFTLEPGGEFRRTRIRFESAPNDD